jgi:hypothetical protein
MGYINVESFKNDLIKMLHEGYNSDGLLNEYSVTGKTIRQILKMIDEQEVSFDIDKIAEELKNASDYLDPPGYVGKEHIYKVELDTAINIVKGGIANV